jgi:hypothetical protein
VIAMTEELWLSALVREWAGRVLPGDHAAATEAATVAMRAYAAGASFAEAYARGQQVVAHRSRQPSEDRGRDRSAAKRGALTPTHLAPTHLRNRSRAADRSGGRSR